MVSARYLPFRTVMQVNKLLSLDPKPPFYVIIIMLRMGFCKLHNSSAGWTGSPVEQSSENIIVT